MVQDNAEKMETRSIKRAKQAEAARRRYHRLSDEERKALNRSRTLEQKRRRHRRAEVAELERILRQTNDIYFDDDPPVMEQEQKELENEVEMTSFKLKEEICGKEEMDDKKNVAQNGEIAYVQDFDPEAEKARQVNIKKALVARARYHRMSPEKKRAYNQRRIELARRRRQEENQLLATPISEINDDLLEKVTKIAYQKAMRAEAARLRYQRMTPAQRKEHNKKRKNYCKKKDVKKEESEEW